MNDFVPNLVCFSCKFGWGYLNGNHQERDMQNMIPVTCSGKVKAAHIINAFRQGADGVIILGCSDGECHFQNGNFQARKRILLLQKTLQDFGIEPARLKIKMNIDPDGEEIPGIIQEMNDQIKTLGPLSARV